MKNGTKLSAKGGSSETLKDILNESNVIELYGKEKSAAEGYYESDIYPGYFDKRSWIDDNGVWHVEPIAIVEREDKIADVYIICPLCGMIHSHGTSINTDIPIDSDFDMGKFSYDDPHPRYGNKLIGHRVSHCGSFRKNKKSKIINNGYYINGPTIDQVLNNHVNGLKIK